jgi:hypothetical protein
MMVTGPAGLSGRAESAIRTNLDLDGKNVDLFTLALNAKF